MALIEIFEFRIKPGNDESLQHVCTKFSEAAAARVDGVASMEFLAVQDDNTRVWQIIRWKDSEVSTKGMQKMYDLPEMGLFSMFMTQPPRRIKNLATL